MAPRRAWSRIAAALCQIGLLFCLGCGAGTSSTTAPPPAPRRALSLSSPAFRAGARIPVRFTCDGARAVPPLRWWGVPRGTRELVLLVTDPDAPGGTFVHWTAYRMAPSARRVQGARQGRNSAGGVGWTPPCPPRGDRAHRYVFALYALAHRSGLPAAATPAEVIGALSDALARTTLVGRYARR